MGLAKRVIPCLDVTAGRVVKGVKFVGLRDAGDPVEIARRYDEQGADELTFLDTRERVNVPAEGRATGYVFQDARLFPHLSVRNNLLYGLQRVRGRPAPIRFESIVELLSLDTLLERRTRELSGGERQRVALGRALLAQPRLLLLDEPLASLDAERRDEVLPYFERLRDEFKVPIIYVSHEFEEVLRLAEQVVLLDQGRVSASGSLQRICLSEALHAIVGPGVIGTLLDAGLLDAVDDDP